ncbi:MAG: aldehyde dehydrogenase [Solirubrobacterales bacterium]|nr:aldehyde dehydrogenase [Solirubrobacterales bacterium]
MRSYGLLIDGKEREGQGWNYTVKASALIANPAEAFGLKRSLELENRSFEDAPGEVVGRCAWASDQEVEEALEAAARARDEYCRTPFSVRRRMAAEFGQEVRNRAEEFVEILIAEGHPRRLAEWEVRGIIDQTSPETMEWYLGQMRTEARYGQRRVRLERKPDGVVCLNPPQNAAGSNSALGFSALVGGNVLVVKAPRSTPLSVMFLYHEICRPILERNGMPPGTLGIVSGDTRRILRQWLASPVVNDVMFFGDSGVGIKFGADCVAAGKKAVLELSGNDGIVIWRDADLDAASAAMCECFYGSGQICMVPKYAIAHPEIADELLERLLERVSHIHPGYPEDPDVVLSPVLKTDKFFDYMEEARQGGAEILSGGRRVDVEGDRSSLGLFIEPTVVKVNGLKEARALACVRDETFFPMLPVVVPESDGTELLDRVISFLNANEYGLRNSLWAADPEVVDRFVTEVRNAGLLKINDSHIGFAPILATHGGTGRTGGPYGELHYPMLRTSHLQGISVAAAGTFTADDLLAHVSLSGDTEAESEVVPSPPSASTVG